MNTVRGLQVSQRCLSVLHDDHARCHRADCECTCHDDADLETLETLDDDLSWIEFDTRARRREDV